MDTKRDKSTSQTSLLVAYFTKRHWRLLAVAFAQLSDGGVAQLKELYKDLYVNRRPGPGSTK